MTYSFFINLTDGELLLFVMTLSDFLENSGDRLNVPATAVSILDGHIVFFKEKYLAVSENGNSGPADTAAKDAARAALTAFLEEFVGSYIRHNKLWTPEELINAGFPEPTVPSTLKQVLESLVVSLRQNENAFILAHGQCKSIKGRGMPPFANVIFFVWDYRNADGTWPKAAECRYNLISFTASATIEVSPEEKAREIVVYGRYHNHFPKPGPWSDGVTIVIG
jgi:hypothetical protein